MPGMVQSWMWRLRAFHCHVIATTFNNQNFDPSNKYSKKSWMCHIWTKIGLKFGNILFHYRVIASGIKQKVVKHTALKVPLWSPTTVLIEPNDAWLRSSNGMRYIHHGMTVWWNLGYSERLPGNENSNTESFFQRWRLSLSCKRFRSVLV